MPQHQTAPSAVSPQVNGPWAWTETNACPPVTGVGTHRFVLVPSPSWPGRLSPQQYVVASVATAQVWTLPVVMLRNVRPPATASGETAYARVVSATPSMPHKLSPQQYAAPPVAIAHV